MQFVVGLAFRDGRVSHRTTPELRPGSGGLQRRNSDAQIEFGDAYMCGCGVAVNERKGVAWSGRLQCKATLAGPRDGLRNRRGRPQDYVEAQEWLNLATSLGNASAAENRDNVAEEMTREQLSEAQRRAREWDTRVRLDDSQSHLSRARSRSLAFLVRDSANCVVVIALATQHGRLRHQQPYQHADGGNCGSLHER